MSAVLGLSMTPDAVGWVIRDEPDAMPATEDHDLTHVASGSLPEATGEGEGTDYAAVIREALAAADHHGRRVQAARVTWSDEASTRAPALLKALSAFDFDLVTSFRPKEAIRTWALASGRALEFEKSAVCFFESTTVTVLAIGYGVARTVAATPLPDRPGDFGAWLIGVFERNRLHCDGLFLLGAPVAYDEVSSGLESRLGMPIITDDCPLALARGAALATSPPVQIIDVAASQQTAMPSVGLFQQIRLGAPKAFHAVSGRPQIWVPAALAVCAAAAVIATYALPPKFSGDTEPARTQNRPASVSATLSDSSGPAGPVTPAATGAPAQPASAIPPPPVALNGAPTVAPTQAASPPDTRRAPQVSIAFEETFPTAPSASPTAVPTRTPAHSGDGPAPDAAGPRWPFAGTATTDPTTEPADGADNSSGGEPGGSTNPSGGQNAPGNGQNPGTGQGGSAHGQKSGGQDSPSGGHSGATT